MVRKLLWSSLLLGPLVIALDYADVLDDNAAFALSAIALIPLAWLIGEATEHAADHTGPGVGGFLNATFGNAPELIIALIALNEGLSGGRPRLADGKRRRQPSARPRLLARTRRAGPIDRRSSFTSIGLVALAVCLFAIPAIPSWSGDRDRDSLVVTSARRVDRPARRLRDHDLAIAQAALRSCT